MPISPTPAKGPLARTGDGFTPEEVELTLKPTLHKWQPRGVYLEVDIGNLESGPGCFTVMGRVVNMRDEKHSSKAPNAAKGCLKLIVKDNTGVLCVGFLHISRGDAE